MLVFGTDIQVLKSGTSVPVEELEVGCPIYNPLTGGHVVLVDMLKRQIVPASFGPLVGEEYTPIRVIANSLGQGVPRKDLMVSCAQGILLSRQTKSAIEVAERSALSLCEEGLAKNEVARLNLPITYFVPLFSAPTVFLGVQSRHLVDRV